MRKGKEKEKMTIGVKDDNERKKQAGRDLKTIIKRRSTPEHLKVSQSRTTRKHMGHTWVTHGSHHLFYTYATCIYDSPALLTQEQESKRELSKTTVYMMCSRLSDIWSTVQAAQYKNDTCAHY